MGIVIGIVVGIVVRIVVGKVLNFVSIILVEAIVESETVVSI